MFSSFVQPSSGPTGLLPRIRQWKIVSYLGGGASACEGGSGLVFSSVFKLSLLCLSVLYAVCLFPCFLF